jgi:hypothetical protein
LSCGALTCAFAAGKLMPPPTNGVSMKRKLIAVAAVSLLAAAGLAAAAHPSAAAPTPQAAPAPAACAHARQGSNPNQHAADPNAPVIPGVNAGNLGTEMECVPLPPLDYAGTAAWEKAHPGQMGHEKGNPGAADQVVKVASAGRGVPTARLAGCTTVCYEWMTALQTGISPAVTTHSWTQRVAKPGLGSDGLPDGHTLAEGTLKQTTTGDTIEGGTTVSASECGGTGVSPCIFVYDWSGTTGYGYNNSYWTNVSGCNPCKGTSVTSWVGTSKIFSFQKVSSQWCFAANNQWVACVPFTHWPSVRFQSGNEIREYFEVAAYDATPNTDAGDAILANCSTPAGSYFINGSYNGSSTPVFSYSLAAANGGTVDATRYNICGMAGSTNYFRGGGPGFP